MKLSQKVWIVPLILLIGGCSLYSQLTSTTGTPGTYFGMSKNSALSTIQKTDKVLDQGDDYFISRGIWEVTRDERLKVFVFESNSLVTVGYVPLSGRGQDSQLDGLQKSGVPLDQIIERAQSGELGAQHELCYSFLYGDTVGRNDKIALRWCTAAANQGSPSSQTLLAEIYGNAKNYAAAFRWYMKAAEKGHPHSQLMVGEYYLVGAGTERDRGKARDWMKKSADQGYSLAKKRLAEIQ